ncbi:MAG: glycosyltransferase family 1 protein [Syntrophobacteraceae bacterium]|nr:glycosyltransferase family 1 protein [Syntrophobacteraceae bacterium]
MPNLRNQALGFALGFIPVRRARSLVKRCSPSVGAAAPPRRRQLLVDVSVTVQNDARTGIQRVVRAILNQLLNHRPAGFFVCPVFATRKIGYRYVRDFPGVVFDRGDHGDGAAVEVEPGDIFLGLDLGAHILPRRQGQLLAWKRRGARLHFMVHDILAVRNPQWFTPKARAHFERWLRTVAVFADGLLCSSHVVKEDVADWLARSYGLYADSAPIAIMRLGADIAASLPSVGLPADSGPLLEKLRKNSAALMVGTIEPRKGHVKVMSAFEELWRCGSQAHLVLVGRPGWRTEALQQTLRLHPQRNNRLHWLDDVSDEMLVALYHAATGVIVASEAEGFGLPLVEAAYYQKPILASDIPIFREIGGDGVTFFSPGASNLAEIIDGWLQRIESGEFSSGCMPSEITTWHDSVTQLLENLVSGG